MSDRYESSSSVGEVKSPKIIKTEASQTYVFICLEQQIDQQQQQGGTGQDASQQRERQNSSPALSSGYDSAIGGSSPSSYNASSTSGGIGGADWQFSGVKLGHFIASLDEEGNTFGAKRKPAFVELDSENVAEELQKIHDEALSLGGQTMLICTAHDVRQLLYPLVASQIGLNIAPGGIALCLSSEGRRNGEALVRFENAEQRELALQRHRKFLSSRYIEVYRATGEEFVQMAYGYDPEARRFASKKAAMIVRMRGLPFNCTEQQIRDFFATDDEPSGGIVEQGILFVSRHDGRPSGDAFVLFGEESVGKKALTTKNKQRIGTRYIELFRTTQAEVQQLFNRVRLNPPTQVKSPPSTGNGTGQQQVQQGAVKVKDCIRLRGLPYEAQVDQVVIFLGEHAKSIIFQGVHMIYTNQGQPSGEAFIQMDTESSAADASAKMHNKYMELGKKKRYIEVFQCSGEDMNLMLSATPLGPPPLAPFVPLGMPPTGSFHPPVTTTGIHHPMNLIQKPPTSSQMVHQPALFSQIPGFPNELPLVSAAILGGGMPFSTPMVQFFTPSANDHLNMLNMNIPLQIMRQTNNFLRQSPATIGMECLYPPPLV